MMKTAVITGAGRGLGREFALQLAAAGYDVAVTDVDLQAAEFVADEIRTGGGQACAHVLDVSNAEEWRHLRDTLQTVWPHLDVLVNNAGVLAACEHGSGTVDDIQWQVSVNLGGTLFGIHTMLPWLRTNPQRARLLNVASYAAFVPIPWAATYNATKAGVLALSETLAVELTGQNVSVTVACPAFFPSNIFVHSQTSSSEIHDVMQYMVGKSHISAQVVAGACLSAMWKGDLHVYVPRSSYWLSLWKRLLPGHFLGRVSRKAWRIRGRFAKH
ncbi:MAG: SDR family NAD(P)-dependent oxidoreductase [Pirellulaceae bacterium]|nr:SDR family NAD(P)-dependent oxidoreductase [Planctomycetales bacterium]